MHSSQYKASPTTILLKNDNRAMGKVHCEGDLKYNMYAALRGNSPKVRYIVLNTHTYLVKQYAKKIEN